MKTKMHKLKRKWTQVLQVFQGGDSRCHTKGYRGEKQIERGTVGNRFFFYRALWSTVIWRHLKENWDLYYGSKSWTDINYCYPIAEHQMWFPLNYYVVFQMVCFPSNYNSSKTLLILSQFFFVHFKYFFIFCKYN